MAQATRYAFSHKELAETLVKKQGIHEGLWAIYLRFGIQGANVGGLAGTPLLPTALVPVIEIGIQQKDKADDLTVDAAKVNPKKKKR
jgi:hypothetical protein